ncbi:MAG TPA: hypothetical protein VF176_06680 [Solirubrobacterales bacterium]
MTERHRVRRPGPAPVIWGSVALFAVLFAFLTYQLAVGRDPALGAKVSAPDRRSIVIRRVIKHRIVTTVVPTPGASSVSSAPSVSAPVPVAPAAAPVVTSAS